jgi:hypothetical protein
MTESTCTATRSNPARKDRDRTSIGPGGLGTALLFVGGFLLVARTWTGLGEFPLDMPAFWYRNGAMWMLIAAAMAGSGVWLLRDRPSTDSTWRPSRPGMRFRRVLVYTRNDCPLCDEALEVLEAYHRWMPVAETADVDGDPDLRERFNTCVPAVEIDGRVRFKGRISEVLLRRLIEGTPPLDTAGRLGSV